MAAGAGATAAVAGAHHHLSHREKSAAEGFLAAFLEEELASTGHEKVAWTGIPRQAQGSIDEELRRVASLANRYPGGMFEGGYSFDKMMEVLGKSGGVANPRAARQLVENHETRTRRS
jgi:hypothetical protein